MPLLPRDFELKIERFLRLTLWLWLYPYIIWFFARRWYRRIAEWVTAPGPEDDNQGSITRI